MRLYSLFRGRRLRPAWSFTASHVLWRFLVSEEGLIVGEDRDTDAKTAAFFCLEMATGKVLWQGKTFGEQWWTGIEALVGGRLYVHGFAKPDMPDHHGLRAIDARSGRELWHNSEISFYAADETRVIGSRDLFEQRVFEEFDASTGAFRGELRSPGADVHELRTRTFGRTDFVFPEPLPDDDPAHMLSRLLFETDARAAIEARPPVVEFTRTPGRLTFSAHVPNPKTGQLTHLLAVAEDGSGKELYRDTLNADTPYPVADSFFIDRGTLYYIKEKQTLVSLPLA